MNRNFRNATGSRSYLARAESQMNAPVYPTGVYLAAVAEVLRTRFSGAVSKERMEEFKANCASDAFQLVVANMDGQHDFDSADYITAALTVGFLTDLKPRPGFESDLCAAALAMDIAQNKMKLVMYAVKMYLESVVKADSAVSLAGSVHIGSIKERLTLTVHVFQSDVTYSEWGTSYRTKGATAEGNVVTWYAKEQLDLGDYSIKGTVTKHNEFSGVQETYLNRVSVG